MRLFALRKAPVNGASFATRCKIVGGAQIWPALPTAAEFPVNPSGYRTAEMREAPTVGSVPWNSWDTGTARWVDNERVLFLAFDKELKKQVERDGKQVSIGVQTLHLWNTRTGEVKRYWYGESLPFCVAGDFVRYRVRRDGKLVLLQGRFGEEKEFEPERQPRPDEKDPVSHFNRFTCKVQRFPNLLGPNKGFITPLRDEHGILEDNKAYAVIRATEPPRRWLHKPDGSSLELPIHDDFVGGPWYSQHLGVYSLRRRDSLISRGMVNKAYLLFPDSGQVNALEIPGNRAWASLSSLIPVKAGLIGISSEINVRTEWDPGDAGLYLFYGATVEAFLSRKVAQPAPSIQVERLSRGSVRDVDVSPDGCKVAIHVDPWDRENRKAYLRMVDICTKGG
jgi:hypothetical protein